MDSDYDSGYAERVGNIFDRLHSLNRQTEEDRALRHRQIIELISRFESTLGTVEKETLELTNQSLKMIAHLQETVKQQEKKMTSNTTEMALLMKKVSSNIKQTLLRHDRQMQISEKAIRDKIKNKIAKMTEEANQCRKSQEQELEEYRTLLEVAGPQLLKQIKYQKIVREQIESKILEQFEAQITDLQELIKTESKVREKEEEQLVHLMKDVLQQVTSLMKKESSSRKESQISLARLLETVIDKIRNEILE